MSYRRDPVVAPRLAGNALRLVSLLAGSGLGGALRNKMIRDAGVLRLLEQHVEETPAFLPPLPRPSSHARPALLLESLLELSRPPLPEGALTIADFVRAYRERRSTPLQVAECVLAATQESEALRPAMRAFIAQEREDVLSQARESSERLARGAPRSVLDGVPIAVKDEVDQVPYPTSVGTRVHGRAPARRDATVVARLRAAGALLIGKTNMHEIGIGVTGLNPHWGTPRNPHDPARHTGGSSSGSAAAVALGLCPAAVAADGGGSIRIPAAFCGLVGLKPTFGRISEHGAAPLCWSLAHLGPIGLTSEDVALLYAVMAGQDDADPAAVQQPDVHLEGLDQLDLAGVRVGVDAAWFEDADAEVVGPCRDALLVLERAGAELVSVAVSDVDLGRLAHLVTIGTEMTASQEPYLREHRHAYGADTRLLFSLVASFPPTLYLAAQRARARVSASFGDVLRTVDVLATPATGCVAPEVEEDALASGESNLESFDRIMRFAPIPNLTGLPAVSVPAGHARHLPVGLQLIGRPWEEHLLLRLCRVVERGVQRRQPRVHFRALN